MTKKLVGFVNSYGVEVLKETGRKFEFFVASKTVYGLPICWEAWEQVKDVVLPVDDAIKNNEMIGD